MALQPEIWIADIEENLFADNAFISKSVDHSAFIANKTVHVPRAGSNPTIVKNRAAYPATIAQRTDSELTYDLDEYTTDPIHITDIDELQTSYAKRQSVIGQHVDTLADRIAIETAHNWGASGVGEVFNTTGAGTAEIPAGASGSRKKVVKEDISLLAKKLDEDNAPAAGRFLLMSPSMYYELFEIDALIRKDFGRSADLQNGVVNRIFGFDVMLRSSVLLYNGTTLAKKAVGAATVAATDSFGAIAWQRNYVAAANGSTKVFADEDKPEYYGSIFSGLKQHGSSKLRTDSVGIAALAQAVV